MLKKEVAIKNSTILATYLFIVWGLYRYLFKLPDEIEELIVKPAIWLIPLIFILKKEGLGLSSLGITTRNLFSSVYLALGLGILFVGEALLINYLKYQSFNFAANIGQSPFFASLGLLFATAISEEVTFRGYLFNRVWNAFGNEWAANILTSIVWALIHLPVTIFIWKLNFAGSITYLFLTTIFGIGSAFVFARTKNVTSSVLLHVLWEWPIILFR